MKFSLFYKSLVGKIRSKNNLGLEQRIIIMTPKDFLNQTFLLLTEKNDHVADKNRRAHRLILHNRNMQMR